ncbi:YdcF family protein [Limoniibacter endophyticus]|uniref:DUF218 domain-containing protein n=1 Tax=Limoniibacter endophyticus TaxID=1565040 RepID=A0A8J3DIX9_9HYPH|nr:YdcF family protein [Limoniibacter endophyticus]GHC76307.1 hypothetical protein GCM10010136_26890 [Limoniibacter endophyticus]
MAFLRILRNLLFAVLACALFFLAGFGVFTQYIGSMKTPADVEAADAIVVVTGGYARLTPAIDLLRTGKGKRLLISGVNPMAKPDEIRIATGTDRKLFDCCVDIDKAALNTIGNATESAKWIRGHKFRSVIVVTNNYHMPRTLLELQRTLSKVELRPYPVVLTRLDDGAWLHNPDAVRVLLTEYSKYLAALVRNFLPLDISGNSLGEAELAHVSGTTAKRH